MHTDRLINVARPGSDERVFWDILMGIRTAQAVLMAHDLGIFELLADGPRTIAEIAESVRIAPRPAEMLLIVCRSYGLLQTKDGVYSLTPVSKDYLIEKSPTYFGKYFDYSIANQELMTYESLKTAVLNNASQVYAGVEMYSAHLERESRARGFTQMMHSHSMAAALAWPDKLDLAGARVFLDIGGGSGAHSIGAVLRWPDLKAIALDLPPVCSVADEYIGAYGLQDRIHTHCSDMWTDSLPAADIHFYSDIFHDFSPQRCRFLARKSFDDLEPGGRIILHEMLLTDDKSGPATIAGYNVSMLLWTEGQQFSGAELAGMLQEAGFISIEVVPTFGYWSIVTGRKPL
jgi:cyclopropane fatty-acyl-phospholipid synthase-like methyltransferase